MSELTAFGPDFPFAYDDWLTHPAGIGSVPETVRGCEVAVVGAGVAGLVAAYELARMGLRPVVYEAGRLGGRLRSEPFSAAPDVVAELGGMRFPKTSRALWHYIDLLGLETRPFPNPLTEAAGRTVVDLGGVPEVVQSGEPLPDRLARVETAWNQTVADAGVPELRAAMAAKDHGAVRRLWTNFVAEWDDQSFWSFVARSPHFSRFEDRETFGQVGFGTGGWDSDFPNTMLEILRVIVGQYDDGQHHVVGGAEQIPIGLWNQAIESGPSLAELHRGAPRPAVRSIERDATDPSRIVVTDQAGVRRRYPCVLVTPQTWLLTTSLGVNEALIPQDVWMALDRTSYMSSSKTFVLVDQAFWKTLPADAELPFSMTVTDRNTRATYLLDNGPDRPAVVILSYAWEADARKVLAMDLDDRVELGIETLEKIYGSELALREHIIGEPITVSWSSDPHFLGAFKGALPGHHRYNRRMFAHFVQRDFAPEHRGLFLAGDGISWTPGWAEGAVQTALNSVWGIMHHLGGSSSQSNPGPGDVWDERMPVDLEA